MLRELYRPSFTDIGEQRIIQPDGAEVRLNQAAVSQINQVDNFITGLTERELPLTEIGRGSEAIVYATTWDDQHFVVRYPYTPEALSPRYLHTAMSLLEHHRLPVVTTVLATDQFSVQAYNPDEHYLNGAQWLSRQVDPAAGADFLWQQMLRLSAAASKILYTRGARQQIGTKGFEVDLLWGVADPLSGKMKKFDNYLVKPESGGFSLKIIDCIRRK